MLSVNHKGRLYRYANLHWLGVTLHFILSRATNSSIGIVKLFTAVRDVGVP